MVLALELGLLQQVQSRPMLVHRLIASLSPLDQAVAQGVILCTTQRLSKSPVSNSKDTEGTVTPWMRLLPFGVLPQMMTFKSTKMHQQAACSHTTLRSSQLHLGAGWFSPKWHPGSIGSAITGAAGASKKSTVNTECFFAVTWSTTYLLLPCIARFAMIT